jgi:hypothetical protein
MPADEISQAERRRVLANDRRVLATYHGVAQTSVDDDRGGRYAKVTTTTVIGASPINYPRQPENSPANQAALVGDEPPLGFSVNDMEPVGEIHERNERNEQRAASKWRRL